MSDDRDDDTRPAGSKSGKGPKKRFQERDDADDEGDDRPRKKRRPADDDDDVPPKKRRGDDDDDEPDEPQRKRRRVEDDGPRVKANDNIPVVMLLAFIGSAVALLATCISCGWFSFAWVAGDGGGWGGNELEITNVTRSQGRPSDPPTVNWSGVTKQNTNTKDGKYYVVMKCGNQSAVKEFFPGASKGNTWGGGGTQQELRGSSGTLEVWVEKRPNPVATGKVVSNVFKVP